jgi:hypothetical protein
MELIVAAYAAIVSTVVGILHWNRWRRERVGAQLTVKPRVHDVRPDRFSHIELDIQATMNPTTIQAVYLAGYKSWMHWLLGREPAEIVAGQWSKIFPTTINPGHGWNGLLAINDRECALAARCPHVRLVVGHTGYGRRVSKPVTNTLRR